MLLILNLYCTFYTNKAYNDIGYNLKNEEGIEKNKKSNKAEKEEKRADTHSLIYSFIRLTSQLHQTRGVERIFIEIAEYG